MMEMQNTEVDKKTAEPEKEKTSAIATAEEVEVLATVKEFIRIFGLTRTPETIRQWIKKGNWEAKKVRNKYLIPIGEDSIYAAKLGRWRELKKSILTRELTIVLPGNYELDGEFLKTIINLIKISPEEVPGFVKRQKIEIPENIYMRITEIAKKIHIRPGELLASLLMVSQKKQKKEVEDDSINSN
jgi:hypothetical protein